MKNLLTKNKNFFFLWVSQILSQFAINLMNFLVLIHIFDKTGSTIASSFVWIAYGLPVVLFGPLAAAWVDTSDKRRILMFANMTQALVIFSYSIFQGEYLYLSYAVVIFYSLLDQFYVPAETSALTQLVTKSQLPEANSLFFITSQAAGIIGFGMSGLLRELIGFSETMFLGSAFLLVAFLASWSLPIIKTDIDSTTDSFKMHLSRMIEGFVFIRKKKQVLYPFLFLISLQVFMSIIVVNLPVIGRDLIGVRSSYSGAVTMLPAGLGSILGTLYISRALKGKKIRTKHIVEKSLLTVSLLFIFMPVLANHLNPNISKLVLVLSFALIGACVVTALVPSVTFMQINTPKNFMARVFGNYWFAAYSVTLLPVLFSATITEVMGLKVVLTLIGLLVGSIYIFSRFKLDKILREM